MLEGRLAKTSPNSGKPPSPDVLTSRRRAAVAAQDESASREGRADRSSWWYPVAIELTEHQVAVRCVQARHAESPLQGRGCPVQYGRRVAADPRVPQEGSAGPYRRRSRRTLAWTSRAAGFPSGSPAALRLAKGFPLVKAL